jgi:transposase
MIKRKVRNYTRDFKESAVQLALRSPSIKVAAKELGIPVPTLATWIYQFRDGVVGAAASPEAMTAETDGLNPNAVKQLKENLAKLLEDNRHLTKKIANLEEERLILKKAAAYFAREQR